MDTPHSAVCFRPEDYASLGRRVISCLIDMGVCFALAAALQLSYAYRYVPAEVRAMRRSPEQQKLVNHYMSPHTSEVAMISLGLMVLYFVPIRRLHRGGAGHRIAGIRLIDHSGRPPGWWALIKRSIVLCIAAFMLSMPYGLMTTRGGATAPLMQLAILGATLVAGILLIYRGCSTRPLRQAVHDQWSGTWMVRANAEPSGPANLFYHTIFMGSFPIRYADVEPLAEPTNSASAPIEARPITAAPSPITADAR